VEPDQRRNAVHGRVRHRRARSARARRCERRWLRRSVHVLL